MTTQPAQDSVIRLQCYKAYIAQTVDFEGNVRLVFDTTGNQDYEGILEARS